MVVKLDILAMHLKECEHNPKKPVPCGQGCGLTVPKDEMVRLHNNEISEYSLCLGGAQLCEGAETAGQGSGGEHLQSSARHDRHEVQSTLLLNLVLNHSI